MSVAKEYLDLFKVTCVFSQTMTPEDETVCGEPAVAVYVSDDEEHRALYVCERHADEAEIHGDGPVFWQFKRWFPAVEEFGRALESLKKATKKKEE